MNKFLSSFAVATALVLAAAPMKAEAAFIFTMSEQGNDVVVTGSGSLNLSGLSQFIVGGSFGGSLKPQINVMGDSGIVDLYRGATGPGSFGPGTLVGLGPDSRTGDLIGLAGGNAPNLQIVVQTGYVSGDPLSTTMIWANETLASLGATPGTYVWSWITDRATMSMDSITLNILSPGAVPEPATLALLGAGLVGLTALRRRPSA